MSGMRQDADTESYTGEINVKGMRFRVILLPASDVRLFPHSLLSNTCRCGILEDIHMYLSGISTGGWTDEKVVRDTFWNLIPVDNDIRRMQR